jgi:adenylyltransferase/sulfurtransferase
MRYDYQKKLLNQKFLAESSILVVGLGGIGGLTSEMMVRSGVGKVFVMDSDKVELSNLHRQVLYDEKDIGRKKAAVAARKLSRMNSCVKVKGIGKAFGSDVPEVDLILDCSDNLSTRMKINKYCEKTSTPWIFATVAGTRCYCNVIDSKEKREWFLKTYKGKKGFRTTKVTGVLPTAASMAACLQATESLKLLSGFDTEKRLVYFDIWKKEIKKFK